MTVFPDPAQVHAPPGARVPDFFIVGHAKSGTTALYEMLRQHPQIYMPDHKEPWFFARSNPHPQTNGERSIAFTGKRMETMEDYLALFRDVSPDQIVGEASTSYLWSTTAASRIAEVRQGRAHALHATAHRRVLLRSVDGGLAPLSQEGMRESGRAFSPDPDSFTAPTVLLTHTGAKTGTSPSTPTGRRR